MNLTSHIYVISTILLKFKILDMRKLQKRSIHSRMFCTNINFLIYAISEEDDIESISVLKGDSSHLSK